MTAVCVLLVLLRFRAVAQAPGYMLIRCPRWFRGRPREMVLQAVTAQLTTSTRTAKYCHRGPLAVLAVKAAE